MKTAEASSLIPWFALSRSVHTRYDVLRYGVLIEGAMLNHHSSIHEVYDIFHHGHGAVVRETLHLHCREVCLRLEQRIR